jgi:NifU-like protein involved in Fe-S cluster formation
MNSAAYTPEILRTALNLAHYPLLDAPDVRVERRAVPCGSTIILDMKFNLQGTVIAMGAKVSACAFGQASAAIMAMSNMGKDREFLELTHAALAVWLRDLAAPLPDWPGIEILAPARVSTARHGAILLPFAAAAEAFAKVQRQDAAA